MCAYSAWAGVNFTYILWAAFEYESYIHSFYLIEAWVYAWLAGKLILKCWWNWPLDTWIKDNFFKYWPIIFKIIFEEDLNLTLLKNYKVFRIYEHKTWVYTFFLINFKSYIWQLYFDFQMLLRRSEYELAHIFHQFAHMHISFGEDRFVIQIFCSFRSSNSNLDAIRHIWRQPFLMWWQKPF